MNAQKSLKQIKTLIKAIKYDNKIKNRILNKLK